jgi:hypothetical protein
MRTPHVIDLVSIRVFAQRTLNAIVAQQGFHVVVRAFGWKTNALRLIPGSVPNATLLQMYVVYVDWDGAYIAKPELVQPVDGQSNARDLLLGPFGEFKQTGVGGPINAHGVSLLVGSVYRLIPHRPRTGFSEGVSHVPSFLPRSA